MVAALDRRIWNDGDAVGLFVGGAYAIVADPEQVAVHISAETTWFFAEDEAADYFGLTVVIECCYGAMSTSSEIRSP